MDLSRLKWIKVVTPPHDWPYDWALSPDEIRDTKNVKKEPKLQYIYRQNRLTVVPLGFKTEKAADPAVGDLMVLTQHAKVTHIVEFLDDKPSGGREWYHRYVKVVWWQPDMKDWNDLPHRQEVLGCDILILEGSPYQFSAFKAFQERWDGRGGLDGFSKHLAQQLTEIPSLSTV